MNEDKTVPMQPPSDITLDDLLSKKPASNEATKLTVQTDDDTILHDIRELVHAGKRLFTDSMQPDPQPWAHLLTFFRMSI
jgi:hypothetical protein